LRFKSEKWDEAERWVGMVLEKCRRRDEARRGVVEGERGKEGRDQLFVQLVRPSSFRSERKPNEPFPRRPKPEMRTSSFSSR